MFKKIYTRIQQSRAEVPHVQNSDLVIHELKKFQPADSEVLQKHTGAIFSSLKLKGLQKGLLYFSEEDNIADLQLH